MSVMPDYLDIIIEVFSRDRYASSLGIVLDDLTPTTIRMHMQLRDDMLNLFNHPHGGAIYSLADVAFSVLGNSANNISVALECSITYHASPPVDALLIVEGEMLAKTRKTASYLLKVSAVLETGNLHVATMKGLVYQTGKPIQEIA